MTAGRLDRIDWLLPLSVAALAVLIGVAAGVDPPLSIALALGVAFAVIATMSLTSGLIGFTFVAFMALLPGFGGQGVNATKGAGALLAISWLASTTSSENRRRFPAEHPLLAMAAILLLSWDAITSLWATQLNGVIVETYSFALNFALFPIVYAAIRNKADVRKVLIAFCLGAVLAAGYGLITQPDATNLAVSANSAGGLDRLSGTFGDPNELATVLAAGIILSSTMLFDRGRSSILRLTSGAIAAMLLFALFLTLSRGGLVALAAGLLAWVLVAGRHRMQALLGVGALAAITVWFFLAFAPPQAKDRLTHADGGSGRTDIWKVGWRMVEAHPVNGVGAGNFSQNAIHYLLVPGQIAQSQYIVDVPSVAHNAYLQVLAETGIVGLSFFLILIFGSLGCTWSAVRTFRERNDHEGELLARGVFVATVAVLAGYFFLADQHSKYMWLLLSLGPALAGLAKHGERG